MHGLERPADAGHGSGASATVDDAPRLVIYQSTNREGSTFALSPDAEHMLEERFGEKLHAVPRVFVAHKLQGDLERLHGKLAKQLAMLLTGLDEEAVTQAGDIEFRDPVTDELI